jgi:carbon storage regulator
LLVLARRKEESIVIGDDVVITILGIEGEKVKIGIEAPNNIRIWRKELYEAITEQNKLAEKLAAAPTEPQSFQSLRQLLESEMQQSRPESEAPTPKETAKPVL